MHHGVTREHEVSSNSFHRAKEIETLFALADADPTTAAARDSSNHTILQMLNQRIRNMTVANDYPAARVPSGSYTASSGYLELREFGT